jgi:protein-S-isoprenylcysteine O-methyltransferase Ste14
MYASLLLLGCGMFFKEMNPITIVLICIITIALFFTCKVEEKEMILRFGGEYEDYMSSTKMWFPFVF